MISFKTTDGREASRLRMKDIVEATVPAFYFHSSLEGINWDRAKLCPAIRSLMTTAE